MRLLLAALATTLVATVSSVASASGQQAPAATLGEAVFVVSGHGWGHGVGMSQYGAYGQALAGRTYAQILGHYYTGTTIGKAGRKEVRVLLAEGRPAVTISSTAPFFGVDAAGVTYELPKAPLTLRTDLALPAAAVVKPAAAPKPSKPVPAKSPLVLRPAKKALLSLDGRPFRGKLELTSDGTYLRVVNVVSLENYVQGVVAGEMPFTWPAEALEAQAVAARSYALANLVKGRPYDLYPDARSQVYVGVAGEKPSTTQAVEATSAEVVLYGGKVATTYYFSTSGGRTASAADVFGFSVPYLVSRPDPWDTLSPYHDWGPVLLGARTVQAKLDVAARIVDATALATPSGRLRSLVLSTTAGPEAIPPSVVRTALGLRSTWVSFGVLRLDQPTGGPVAFGTSMHLSGIGRALGTPRLTASADGRSWSLGQSVTPDASGVIATDVTPMRTTRYRLEASGAASPAVLVQVAPRIALARPTSTQPTVLSGVVRPKTARGTVTIERHKGTAWVVVGTASVTPSGTFRLELDGAVPVGSYRAQLPASAEFAAAISPVLAVSG